VKKVILLLVLFIPLIASGESAEKIPVIIDADEVSYMQAEGKVVMKGNVVIKHKEAELFCDEGEFDTASNLAHVRGRVKIIKEDTVLYGENVIYNFNTYDADMINARVEDAPIYGEARDGDKYGQEKYILKNGFITTCDLAKPHYRLVSKRITIYPNERVVARNMVLMIGRAPVFYIPYYTQHFDSEIPPIEVVPGKNDDWGYFSLNAYRYELDKGNKGRFHFNWYEKRGWAFGVTHKTESKYGKALAKYIALQDKMHRLDKRNSFLVMYGSRSSIADKYLEDDRYRANLTYAWKPLSDLSITSEFHKFSDENFLKDFFEEEYEINPSPLSYLLVTKALRNSSLSFRAQKRVNRFYSQTEYLPQLEYSFFQQEIGDSKFYFDSSEKLSNLTYKRQHSGTDDDAIRLISDSTLHYTNKIKWLHVNPYVGTHANWYSKNKFGDEDVWRIAPKAGANLSVKLYRLLDKKGSVFGEDIDKMRHVLTPQVSYSYAHDPTVSDNNLFQFGGDDSLSRSETVTFTLSNKLQARNKERTWDFVYFSPSFTYRIHPEGGVSRFESISSDLEIYPKEGLSVTSNVNYNVPSRRISSFNLDFTTKGKYKILEAGKEVEKEKYSFTYGHRYSRQSDTQGTIDFSYQLTPKIKTRSYWRYEFNRGDLEEQQYRISLDLHCWWMDFGVDSKKHRVGGKNFTFWVEFRLKAFPNLSVSFDEMQENAKSEY